MRHPALRPLALLALLVAACGGGGDEGPLEPPAPTGVPEIGGRWEGTVTWVRTTCRASAPEPERTAVVIEQDGQTLRWRFEVEGSPEWFGHIQEGGAFGVTRSSNQAGDRTSSTIRGTATETGIQAREDFFQSLGGATCEEVREFDLGRG